MKKPEKKKIILLFFLFFFLPYFILTTYAQGDNIRLRYQSAMIGIGNTKIHDSYLSPLTYSGTSASFIYESIKMTNLMDGNVSAQHLINLDIAETSNPTGTAKDYLGLVEYTFGLHYKFTPIKNLLFFGGLQVDCLLGGIYNTRNGNNPATGKAHLNFNLSGLASYSLKVKKQPFLLRYQLNIPFIGAFFAPQFGQSYYEIGLGADAPLVHFGSLHNYRAMHNLLSADIPLSNCTIRFAYANWIYQTDINDIQTKIVSNSFYLGFSRNIYTLSGKRTHKYMIPFFEK